MTDFAGAARGSPPAVGGVPGTKVQGRAAKSPPVTAPSLPSPVLDFLPRLSTATGWQPQVPAEVPEGTRHTRHTHTECITHTHTHHPQHITNTLTVRHTHTNHTPYIHHYTHGHTTHPQRYTHTTHTACTLHTPHTHHTHHSAHTVPPPGLSPGKGRDVLREGR